MGMEFEDAGFLGGAVGPFEEDLALAVVANDSVGAEGGPLDVSGEVAEGGFSATDGLEVDVPLGFWGEGSSLVWGEVLINIGVLGFEGAVDEASKTGGEGVVVDEELAWVFWAVEALVFWVEGDGRNDDVDVRVVLGSASPCVKNGGEVEDEVLVFEFGSGDVVEGLGAGFEEEAVEFFWTVKAQGAELLWYCEGDHEVRDSQEFGFLFDGPYLLVFCAALGAVPMVAGVVGVVFFAASGVGASVEAATEFGGPAREDAPDRLVVDAGYFAAVCLGVGCPVDPQDVCEGQHDLGSGRWLYLLSGSGRVVRAWRALLSLMAVRWR